MASEGQNTNGTHPGFGQRVDEIGHTAQHLIDEARSAVEDLRSTLDVTGRVKRHPYAMIGAALGIGYVLGGGLFSSFTARLIKLGVRLAALPVVRSQLIDLAEDAIGALERSAGQTPGTPDGNNNPQ